MKGILFYMNYFWCKKDKKYIYKHLYLFSLESYVKVFITLLICEAFTLVGVMIFRFKNFSVWENSEFCFKGLSKWKFRLAIDTVHKNSVYERNTNYESGYFQRVTWSVSHCDIACAARLNDSCALQSKLASYRMYTVQGMPSLDCALWWLNWEMVNVHVRHDS